MSILRAGILGCGDFANRHAEILIKLPEQVELVAFSDRNEWKAQEFAEKYTENRATVFSDHHALLDQAKLDLLYICVPPYGHTDEVELAAEHGVHLLIEKPIALTSEKGWQMVEAAEKAGIKTQVGFMLRFGEAVEELKKRLDSGEIGSIGLMSGRYFCNSLHSNWWRMKDKSGGQLLEQAIHIYDLMRYLAGDAAAVYSRQENLFHQDTPDYTIEDVSASVISFKNGGLAVVYATNNAIPGRWIQDYRVVAQKMTVDFTNVNEAVFYPTEAPNQEPLKVTSERDFRLHQTLDLLNAIQTGGETRTPLREGAKSLDLVLGAVKSNEKRGEIAL
jgi:predicted dehydrogenase